MRRVAVAMVALAAIVVGLFAAAPLAARAEIDAFGGECAATVAGVDVARLDSRDRGDAIRVDRDDSLTVSMTATPGDRHRAFVDLLGRRIEVLPWRLSESGTLEREVEVSDYAAAGPGLYRLVWESAGRSGPSCRAAVLFDVAGNPLTAPAGLGALGAAGVAAAGLTFSVGRAINAGRAWKVRIAGTAEVDRDERKRRLRGLRLKYSTSAAASGLLSGGALITMLQQGSITWPTVELSLAIVIPFSLLAALLPDLGFRAGGGGASSRAA